MNLRDLINTNTKLEDLAVLVGNPFEMDEIDYILAGELEERTHVSLGIPPKSYSHVPLVSTRVFFAWLYNSLSSSIEFSETERKLHDDLMKTYIERGNAALEHKLKFKNGASTGFFNETLVNRTIAKLHQIKERYPILFSHMYDSVEIIYQKLIKNIERANTINSFLSTELGIRTTSFDRDRYILKQCRNAVDILKVVLGTDDLPVIHSVVSNATPLNAHTWYYFIAYPFPYELREVK